MLRGIGAKDVERDGGKVCGGGWGKRIYRGMGAKDIEGNGGKGCSGR